jgi:predicted nucleotidyltransferase
VSIWQRRFDPEAAARRAVLAAVAAVGDRLVGATLYGSAAGGEFLPAQSDVNVAFVFSAMGAGELEALRRIHRRWRRERVTRPLLVTREGLRRSLDVYPLEYLLIRERHVTLHGEDCFAGIEIERGALRRAVERVLRGQELGLAWTYVALTSTPSGARHWAARAGTAMAASASGLLYLAGEPIPATRRAIAERTAARFGVDPTAIIRLLDRPSTPPEPVEASRLLETAQTVLARLIEAAEGLDGASHKP